MSSSCAHAQRSIAATWSLKFHMELTAEALNYLSFKFFARRHENFLKVSRQIFEISTGSPRWQLPIKSAEFK